MARIVFFCHDTLEHIINFEYYRGDTEALEALGHEVVISRNVREIPRKFDAMIVWWWTHALAPVIVCRFRGRPVLVTGVYNFRNPPEFKGRDYFGRPVWQRALIAAATKLCDLNLFLDEGELAACAAYFGLTNARYYPAVVHDDYLLGPAPERELAVFNIAWSGKGNIIRKGLPELFQAMKLLKDDGVNVHFYQAGLQGDGAPLMAEWRDAMGLADRVHLLGPLSREDKIARLRRYELYAQPSHFEGFGLATAEAMGSGACVITCDVGAVRSVVGDRGIYVTPGSPTELAAAIRRALTDEGLRRRMQQGAVERARSAFAAAGKRDRLRMYLQSVGIS